MSSALSKGTRFQNSVALVTGAGRGIGESYAKALAREGVGACLFLLSDDARWVTAQIVAVDGGFSMRA